MLCLSSRGILGAADRYLVEVVEVSQEPICGGRMHLGFRRWGAAGDYGDALAVGRPREVVRPRLYLHVLVRRYSCQVLRERVEYIQVGRRLQVEAPDDSQSLAVGRDADARCYKVLSHTRRGFRRAALLRHTIDLIEWLQAVAVYEPCFLSGYEVEVLPRPLGRAEDLLVAVQPRYLSPS